MGASQDTVNNVYALKSAYRRKFIDNSGLPSHTKVNLHEFDPIFEENLPEFLTFASLEASQTNLTATQTLAAAVSGQVQIAKDQGETARTLVKLTWGLLVVAAGTLAASVVLVVGLSGHL